MENAVKKQKTILFVGRIHQPGPIHGDNPTHAAPSVRRCRVGPGACVAHQSATALSPWARLSGGSPPNSLLTPARNPAAAAPVWSAHHPLVAVVPARLHAPLSPSCPLRAAEPSPLSAAPACTLPLRRHDPGRSRSMTSHAQQAVTGHSLPPAIATPRRHQAIRSCACRPTSNSPLGAHTLWRGHLCVASHPLSCLDTHVRTRLCSPMFCPCYHCTLATPASAAVHACMRPP
jgi:hypothetical protein